MESEASRYAKEEEAESADSLYLCIYIYIYVVYICHVYTSTWASGPAVDGATEEEDRTERATRLATYTIFVVHWLYTAYFVYLHVSMQYYCHACIPTSACCTM